MGVTSSPPSGSLLRPVTYQTLTFTVASPCGSVTITSPPPGSIVQGSTVVLQGTNDPRCSAISISSSPDGTALTTTSTTGRWTITANNIFKTGTHNLVATSSGAPGSATAATSFTVNALCPLPTVNPTTGTFFQSPSFTVSSFGTCTTLNLFLGNAATPLQTSTGGTGVRTLTIAGTLASGVYTYRLGAVDPTGFLSLGPLTQYFSFTVATNACAQPYLQLVPGTIYPSGTVTFTGTDPNGGQVQCPSLAVIIDGVMQTATFSTTSRRRATRQWSYTANSLAPGSHSIQVVPLQYTSGTADQPGPATLVYRSSTGSRNFIIAQPAPAPTVSAYMILADIQGGMRRRHTSCAPDQDYCPYKTGHGRLAYECVQDLSSNLERCGSCDGPDCTEVENADVSGLVYWMMSLIRSPLSVFKGNASVSYYVRLS